MKRKFLTIVLLFAAITCYSQSKSIIGSWISLDTIHKTQFFINANGSFAKRTAMGGEDVWNKSPQTGTYTFTNNSLVLTLKDKTTETIKVRFVKNNAEFYFVGKKGKLSKPKFFLRVVDEEVVPDK